MTSAHQEIPAVDHAQPPLLVSVEDGIAVLTLNRPRKRNAVSDAMLVAIERFFAAPPKGARVAVLRGAGGHFSAGLDLEEAVIRDQEDVIAHSRNWHRVMDLIQFGGLPVVSVLEGAVIGGGMEIATATHVRVAEPGARFQLPEGKRGIFVGGGATVRVSRIIGADRMTEMMLTGRSYSGAEAERLGLAHYLVAEGEAFARAMELARDVASNATLVNYLVIQSIARIASMGPEAGLYAESLSAAISQGGADAREGLTAFLERREPRFGTEPR
jgi:(methylthio)acryloyl-CoA hydratase